VIRVFDSASNLIQTHEHNGEFKEPWSLSSSTQSGEGWPQRSQLQPDIPWLGRCVTLLPATFCNFGL